MRVRLGKTGSTTAADCQLFLWQAERTTRIYSRDDPREDVGVGVRVRVVVGPVEFQLHGMSTVAASATNNPRVGRRLLLTTLDNDGECGQVPTIVDGHLLITLSVQVCV